MSILPSSFVSKDQRPRNASCYGNTLAELSRFIRKSPRKASSSHLPRNPSFALKYKASIFGILPLNKSKPRRRAKLCLSLCVSLCLCCLSLDKDSLSLPLQLPLFASFLNSIVCYSFKAVVDYRATGDVLIGLENFSTFPFGKFPRQQNLVQTSSRAVPVIQKCG